MYGSEFIPHYVMPSSTSHVSCDKMHQLLTKNIKQTAIISLQSFKRINASFVKFITNKIACNWSQSDML